MFEGGKFNKLASLVDSLNTETEERARKLAWLAIELEFENPVVRNQCIIVCYCDSEDGFSPPYYWLAELKYMSENDQQKLFEPDYTVWAYSTEHCGMIMLSRKNIVKLLEAVHERI